MAQQDNQKQSQQTGQQDQKNMNQSGSRVGTDDRSGNVGTDRQFEGQQGQQQGQRSQQ